MNWYYCDHGKKVAQIKSNNTPICPICGKPMTFGRWTSRAGRGILNYKECPYCKGSGYIPYSYGQADTCNLCQGHKKIYSKQPI